MTRTLPPIHRAATLTGVALMMAAIGAATMVAAGRAQNTDEQTVGITLGESNLRATGVLRVPAAATRPPVVCLVTDGDAVTLAAALAAERIASLRMDAKSPDAIAQWISFLRNDERFPVVTVFAEGDGLQAGVIAGRAGRADGIVTRGDTTPAAAELARVVATVKTINAASASDAARQIAAFVRSVPALGRRGTSPGRTAGRRSLRHTVMASIGGGVRVAVEWGQPQMRGRVIWGALVPWGTVWMPGADEATVITTDGPIMVGTVEMPAGDHTFYTLPAADQFQLLISRDVGQFHTVYNPSLVIGRTNMDLRTTTDSTEGLTFTLQPAAGRRPATLALGWDQREYSVALTVR